MKNYLLIAFAVLLLFSCNNKKTNQQIRTLIQQDKNTEIYLKVINNINNCESIEDCIQFSDNRGDVSELSKTEVFTSIVNADKKVIWMGAENSVPKIEIIEVNFKDVTGSKNILEEKKMKGKKGIVIGKVKPKDSLKFNDIEFYSITFKIDNVEYTIDPKLEYH